MFILATDINFFDSSFNNEAMKKLLSSNEQYDLLLINGYGSDQFFVLAHHFQIPIIQVRITII